jgi:hypothetical protein
MLRIASLMKLGFSSAIADLGIYSQIAVHCRFGLA